MVGVLAQQLDRAAIAKENRTFIAKEQLLLISPFDPSAGFNVGNAMARNKLIYACAKGGLVASVDQGRGGTWSGAIEQLKSESGVPIYVRTDDGDEARESLLEFGAKPWPAFVETEKLIGVSSRPATSRHDGRVPVLDNDPLFVHAVELIAELKIDISWTELQRYLGITSGQLNAWIPRLIEAGALQKISKKPVKYRANSQQTSSLI